MRKVIAERMHQSLHSSAQITIAAEADVTPATEFRARLSREFDFSYTDMMIHSVARALMRHPRMNARLNENGAEIVLFASANVGIAVALDEGLIVPVVNRAESKSLREIAVESRALGEKARAGNLKLEDVSGGTFTITNLGMFGIDAFTPILNPGETGILGVGRIVEKPAVYRGEIAKRAKVKQAGLWAPHLPPQYGGAGLGFLEHAYMNEVLAYSMGAAALFGVVAPNSGNQQILLKYGTEEQKRTWLVPLTEGKMESGFSMTEPTRPARIRARSRPRHAAMATSG